jgi:hypothetical protein
VFRGEEAIDFIISELNASLADLIPQIRIQKQIGCRKITDEFI